MSTRKPSAPRHYGDEEVRQLLEHATQLQQAGEPEDPEEGVTLAELEEAAAEVGIRPRYIRRAAALLGNPGAKADSAISKWLGVSPHRLIQGEIGDEDWNSLIVEIERIVGRGTVKATSRPAGSLLPCKTLRWLSADQRTWIHMISNAGKTEIWVGDNRASTLGSVLGGSLGAVFIVSMGHDAGSLWGLGAAIVLGVLLFVGSTLLFTRLGSSLMSPGMERSEALESLVARVAGCVQPEYEGPGE